MSEAKYGSQPKPPIKLKGHQIAAAKRNVIFALIAAGTAGFLFKVFVSDVRKEKYAEFYRTYDAEKAFERMAAKGVFQSVPMKAYDAERKTLE